MKNKQSSKVSFITKLKNYFNKPQFKPLAILLVVLLVIGIVSGALFQVQKNGGLAFAALNCPSGSTVNVAGTGCISNTPSSYVCGSGFLSGTNCFVTVYSCPSGGTVSGASCVGSLASPVPTSGCPIPSSTFLGSNGFGDSPLCSFVDLGSGSELIPSWSDIAFSGVQARPAVGSCTGLGGAAVIYNVDGYFVCSYPTATYYLSGQLYSSQASYAATPSNNLIGAATPQYNTAVTPTSYTPNNGQITGLTCTPSSVAVSGTVSCSGQGTGAPSGVPYAGNVTVSIDNGGGSIITTFNSDGTFTASSVPVGNTAGAKNATTNLGGTTPVTVTSGSGSTTVDPDLSSGPGSLSNATDCTSSTLVTIGTTYTCTFPISGTGPFVLPSGGIQARTNQGSNNSTPVSTCTISSSNLICTGITTVGSPSALTAGAGNVQLGKGTTPSTLNNKGAVLLTTSTGTTITATNISNSTNCTSALSVNVGTTYSCDFPLTGDSNNLYALPTSGIVAGTSTATGQSPACTISGNGTAQVKLVCASVPTTAGTVGLQNVLLFINGSSSGVDKGDVTLTSGSSLFNCSVTNPCALFDTSLTYSPTQALAKRYGGSGSTTAGDLILTLNDSTRLAQSGYTTTCTFRYKFKSDTTWRNLSSTVAYNASTGCNATLLKADQLFWNVDFEITAVTTNGTETRNFLLYNNYDFKAGSIGVTSIGGSGL
jgi:hypothetical protein